MPNLLLLSRHILYQESKNHVFIFVFTFNLTFYQRQHSKVPPKASAVYCGISDSPFQISKGFGYSDHFLYCSEATRLPCHPQL